jgi:hypothetical protein
MPRSGRDFDGRASRRVKSPRGHSPASHRLVPAHFVEPDTGSSGSIRDGQSLELSTCEP